MFEKNELVEKHHQINGVNLHCQKALPKDSSGGGQRNAGGGGGYRSKFIIYSNLLIIQPEF
jgi:hypothetical protein